MHIVSHHLGHGGSVDLRTKSLTGAGAPALAVVQGGGRGCVLRCEGTIAGIWIPLHGRLQIGADLMAHTGDVCVTEPESGVRAVGRGGALWVAVLGTAQAWRRALDGPLEVPAEPLLLPATYIADRGLRSVAVSLVRAAAKGAPDNAIEALLDRVVELQEQFSPAIARCPGRTYCQRRQVFLRLQRVRNYLSANCHLDIDNDALARMANYSPWHFIRAFRAAYGETPHAYLVRQRLERARRMLYASPLGIAEIALAAGFENRCAFSRLFRERFGTTAAALRRSATAV